LIFWLRHLDKVSEFGVALEKGDAPTKCIDIYEMQSMTHLSHSADYEIP
jgi:hypothetical protein